MPKPFESTIQGRKLRRSTIPGTSGYIRSKLTMARTRDRELVEQRNAHLRLIAALEFELAQAEAREAAEQAGNAS